MQLRWTEEAANDLEHIADYLFEHAPDRAAELVRAIFDAPAALLNRNARAAVVAAALHRERSDDHGHSREPFGK